MEAIMAGKTERLTFVVEDSAGKGRKEK